MTIPGERGRVLDRNGKVLAASEDAADVVATPYQVKNPGQTALRLHDILGEPTTDLVSKLARSQLRLRVPGPEGGSRTSPPRIEKLNITGVSTVPTSRRLYPQGELAAQVIGAVGTDNQGLTGLEHSENDVLGGANGEQDVVHDARRSPAADGDRQAGERRRGRPDDDRRGDSGQDRGGAVGRRPSTTGPRAPRRSS